MQFESWYRNEHSHWMQLAIQVSRQAIGLSSPNPPVGAVVVNNGRLISTGHTQIPGQAHAEVMALRHAGDNARGATLYVTLEPCCFHGRTPPCTTAIVQAGIKRLVYACRDYHPQVNGHGVNILTQAGLEVLHHQASEKQVQSLLHPFFRSMVADEQERLRPEFIMKAAITLDGFIATQKGSSRWISHFLSRILVHRLRMFCDAIIIGSATARTDDPMLDIRLDEQQSIFGNYYYPGGVPHEDALVRMLLLDRTHWMPPKPILRVILDPSLSLGKKSRLAQSAQKIPTLIIVSQKKLKGIGGKIKIMQKLGLEVEAVRPMGQGLDVNGVAQLLLRRGILRALVEGGSRLHRSFFLQGLYDRFFIFGANKVLMGDNGIGMMGGNGVRNMDKALPIANGHYVVLPHPDVDFPGQSKQHGKQAEQLIENFVLVGAKDHVYRIG